MTDGGKSWGKGSTWSEEELATLREHPELSASKMSALLPGRTSQAIGNMRMRRFPTDLVREHAQPPVKAPGDYVETLSAYLTDEFECLHIWLKWNGYATCRELQRTRLGWVTLLCTAK